MNKVSNHWLNKIKEKALFASIEEHFMDVWGNDGNLNDLFAALNQEEADFLLNMPIKDFAADPDDLAFGFELTVS